LSARKRVAATGSQRAEFEHVHGPMETDPVDARFVLIDEETEQKLRELRPGIPPLVEQPWDDVVQIKEAVADAQGAPEVDQKSEDAPVNKKSAKKDSDAGA
jgi:hypothetical protein